MRRTSLCRLLTAKLLVSANKCLKSTARLVLVLWRLCRVQCHRLKRRAYHLAHRKTNCSLGSNRHSPPQLISPIVTTL
ncbi:hypothetical protein C8R48DRAFT_703817 [Suillus tomentosus]|nr:hypothetical protein C8R48DRAFT_703817 [Suillus tomentosus]